MFVFEIVPMVEGRAAYGHTDHEKYYAPSQAAAEFLLSAERRNLCDSALSDFLEFAESEDMADVLYSRTDRNPLSRCVSRLIDCGNSGRFFYSVRHN